MPVRDIGTDRKHESNCSQWHMLIIFATFFSCLFDEPFAETFHRNVVRHSVQKIFRQIFTDTSLLHLLGILLVLLERFVVVWSCSLIPVSTI